jgi:hypothetical protein
VTLFRAVAATRVFSDGVNFWFLAERNHGRLWDAVPQKPAINQTLTIPDIFQMLRALGLRAMLVWFTPLRWRFVGRRMHGRFGMAVGRS